MIPAKSVAVGAGIWGVKVEHFPNAPASDPTRED
jgi:hypothetical protein